jgi:hypothetical protein
MPITLHVSGTLRRARAAIAGVLHTGLKREGEEAGIVYDWSGVSGIACWLDNVAPLMSSELISRGVPLATMNHIARVWRAPGDILDIANDYCSGEVSNTLRDRLASGVPAAEIKAEWHHLLQADIRRTYSGPAASFVSTAVGYLGVWHCWLGRHNVVNKLRYLTVRDKSCSTQCRAAVTAYGLRPGAIHRVDDYTATLQDCVSALSWLLSDTNTACDTCYASCCDQVESAIPIAISNGLSAAIDVPPCSFDEDARSFNTLVCGTGGVLERLLHYAIDHLSCGP